MAMGAVSTPRLSDSKRRSVTSVVTPRILSGDPRASFPHDPAAEWDDIQVAYFASYATWNYLTLPFLLTAPGIEVAEVEPWAGGDPSWRRVSADFSGTATETHNRLQYYNFDAQNLLVRHDYDADVLGGVPARTRPAPFASSAASCFPPIDE
jgi:hypothetical protein